MPFLDKIAQYVLENYSDRLHRICLVTPNRRAGLFLKKYFSRRASKAVWAPDVMSMEDFISRISGISIQEPFALLMDFYNVYVSIEKENAESLEEFLKWAPMLIKDFNDIDAHVDEPEQLFGNVLDVKKIEAWNPDGQQSSEYQQKYLKFFQRMKVYHEAFREKLLSRKTAYQGLAFRQAAMDVKSEKAEIPWEKILFVGFNALNMAEETIIRTLVRKGTAEIKWDADKYYLENKEHEAGHFMRKYRDSWNMSIDGLEDNFSIKTKNIFVYGVAKNVNQARLAGNILKGFSKEDITENQTAVVLAAEELLLPMMHSLPANVNKVNITMGYPLRKTSMYGLFDAIFQMHLTTLRMNSVGEGMKSAFYHKDLIRFLRHPAINILWGDHDSRIDALVKNIISTNKTFLSFDALAGMSGEREKFNYVFGFLFRGFARQADLLTDALRMLTDKLDEAFRMHAEKSGIPVETAPWFTDFEALHPIGIILRKLQNFETDQKQVQDLKTLFMLFQAMARESRIAMVGEPLNGLQIMGMLETRNLDFKNLIILSANEGILPAAKGGQSLIPFDVKAGFGIPVYKEKDAIFAYHFYRLLQRAENVHIIYNTQSQDLGSSEKSRFITQLQMEIPAWNPNISITDQIIALPPAKDEIDHEIIIPKTPEILNKLVKISEEKGFSPSTLSHYIRCPLFFYFRHIAGIKESEKLEETIEANTLGTVVHEVLQNLYQERDLEGKVLNIGHIDKMYGRVEALTQKSFEENYTGGDITSGKNLLLYKVALRFVRNFLDREKEHLNELQKSGKNITYIKAEDEMHCTLPVEIGGEEIQIKFRGFADRIDSIDGTIRVIDYKTGKVEDKELKFNNWPEVIEKSNQGKSFQLLMYAMLYRQNYGDTAVIPGIISLRHLSKGLFGLSYPGGKDIVSSEAVDAFENELKSLIQEIFNPAIPFTRTPDEDNCKNCDFRVVCNR
jgi:CRISPR/Cas system-associated exonuclease Cas4 (RecB family)